MWKKTMNLLEVAELIERFLEKKPLYRQEWTDFVDTPQRDPVVNAYRKRCYELDPLVNRPGEPEPEAVSELQTIVQELREQSLAETTSR
jgi:hypothetical protein